MLDVKVNEKPAAVLLDTGAQVSIVDMHSVKSLPFHIDKLSRLQMSSCPTSHVSILDSMEWICVSDLSDVEKNLHAHIDGVLGQDLLRKFFNNLRIDYKRSVVEFEK